MADFFNFRNYFRALELFRKTCFKGISIAFGNNNSWTFQHNYKHGNDLDSNCNIQRIDCPVIAAPVFNKFDYMGAEPSYSKINY